MEKKPMVLVISSPHENWYKICEKYSDVFNVEQACWEDVSLTSYPETVVVNLSQAVHPISPQQKKRRTITPNIVLIRMLCRYVGIKLGANSDFRNVLYGFLHANIPMVNSFSAVLCELERPIMMGRLKQIEKKLGKDVFTVIPQTYYSEASEMVVSPEVPFVIKYSYPHAGYGKIRIRDYHDFPDFRSIVALDNYYTQAEPLIDSEYEVRIVFIAPDYYRAHKRQSTNWKVNFGTSNIREDIEFTPKYKMWVDEIRKEFPDIDTFCIDTIIAKDGKEYILEMNGSAQGFAPEHCDEEHTKLCELVISKLQNKELLHREAIIESDSSLEILNLKNKISSLENDLEKAKLKNDNLQQQPVNKVKPKSNHEKPLYFIILTLLVLCIAQFIFKL